MKTLVTVIALAALVHQGKLPCDYPVTTLTIDCQSRVGRSYRLPALITRIRSGN